MSGTRQPSACEKRLFLNFSYVGPESVLVKWSLCIPLMKFNGSKKGWVFAPSHPDRQHVRSEELAAGLILSKPDLVLGVHEGVAPRVLDVEDGLDHVRPPPCVRKAPPFFV